MLPPRSVTLYFGCSTLLAIGPHKVAPTNHTANIPTINHISFLLTLKSFQAVCCSLREHVSRAGFSSQQKIRRFNCCGNSSLLLDPQPLGSLKESFEARLMNLAITSNPIAGQIGAP